MSNEIEEVEVQNLGGKSEIRGLTQVWDVLVFHPIHSNPVSWGWLLLEPTEKSTVAVLN